MSVYLIDSIAENLSTLLAYMHNIETDIYHVKPEEVEGYPNALGFDLTKAVKVNG